LLDNAGQAADLANLEAQELADFADHELDLATSLGDTVVVSGLSLGGVLSVSWGVLLAHKLPAARLRQLFCLVLLGTAAAMLLAPR